MSDESKVSEQLRGTSASSNPRNQPREPYDSFFRGDFRRLFKYLESLCKGEPTAQSERDAFTDAMRWCCACLVKNTAVQGMVMSLVFVGIWYGLYARGVVIDEAGRIDANWVTALLTLAVVIYSILQWSVVKKQTNEFVRQNEIMIEQNKALAEQNQLTREQLAHTRYQMKLENRAWLGISGVELKPLMPGYNKVRCTITVKNSGKTQGKIISGLTNYFVRYNRKLWMRS